MDKPTCAVSIQCGPTPELYDTDEAADYLRVRAHTLEVWRTNGRYNLPFIKVGRNVRYRRRDLDHFLESRTVGAESTSADAAR